MKNTRFPDCSGNTIWDLREPQDSAKVGWLQLVTVDRSGKVRNVVEEIADGGGHVEMSRHALNDVAGFESETDAEQHSLVVIHG